VTGVKTGFQVPFFEGIDIVERVKAMQSGQGKCFKYCLSHPTGKIEIVGKLDDSHMVFKYHQFKSTENAGRIFIRKLSPDDAWLGEIETMDN
jgi:L-lysine 2,3-aminomutase